MLLFQDTFISENVTETEGGGFLCNPCDKVLTTKGGILRHVEDLHVNAGVRFQGHNSISTYIKLEAVHGLRCSLLSDVPRRSWKGMFRCPSAFVVGDVQMSLGVGDAVTLGTSEHPIPRTASKGHLNTHNH